MFGISFHNGQNARSHNPMRSAEIVVDFYAMVSLNSLGVRVRRTLESESYGLLELFQFLCKGQISCGRCTWTSHYWRIIFISKTLYWLMTNAIQHLTCLFNASQFAAPYPHICLRNVGTLTPSKSNRYRTFTWLTAFMVRVGSCCRTKMAEIEIPHV